MSSVIRITLDSFSANNPERPVLSSCGAQHPQTNGIESSLILCGQPDNCAYPEEHVTSGVVVNCSCKLVRSQYTLYIYTDSSDRKVVIHVILAISLLQTNVWL